MAGSDDQSEFFMFLVTSAARDGAKTTAVGRGVHRITQVTNGCRGVHRGGRHEGRRLDNDGRGVCRKSEGGRDGRRHDRRRAP